MQALELAVLAGVDLIVMAPDLLAVELHVGQCALWLEKPLFHASVYGPALTLHVRSFLNQQAAGPCPVCRYGRAEFELLSRQTRFSCEGAAGADRLAPGCASHQQRESAVFRWLPTWLF